MVNKKYKFFNFIFFHKTDSIYYKNGKEVKTIMISISNPLLDFRIEPKVAIGFKVYVSVDRRLKALAGRSGLSMTLLMRHIINEALTRHQVEEQEEAKKEEEKKT